MRQRPAHHLARRTSPVVASVAIDVVAPTAAAPVSAPAPVVRTVAAVASSLPLLPNGRTPSQFQAAIGDWVRNGSGHGFCDAVAGSGKTTTLEWLAGMTPVDGAAFVAFNVKIRDELTRRLPGRTVMTIHQAGRRQLANSYKLAQRADMNKGATLVREAINTLTGLEQEAREALFAPLRQLHDMVRIGLVDVRDRGAVAHCIDFNDIDIELDLAMQLLPGMLAKGLDLIKRAGIHDLTDMLWGPNVLPVKATRFTWLFVDEAQDLSPAAREVVMRMIAPQGRALFVGDPSQAIYAFAGADSRSVERIIERTKAVKLPLSVSYRCPRSHVELAQQFVPHLQARDGAPEGVIGSVTSGQLVEMASEGDLVMCRVTKHLITLVYDFIEAGIPARVLGRDIGTGLVAVVKKVVKASGCTIGDYLEAQSGWVEGQVSKLAQTEGNEMRIESIQDKASGISAILRATNPASIDQLLVEIAALFSDERASVTLATVHKAKGLEAERTFILHRELMPHPMARTPDAKLQEQNIEYIAYTRSTSEMYFVED